MTSPGVIEDAGYLADPAWSATRRATGWALGLGGLSVALHLVRLVNLPGANAARRAAAGRPMGLDSLAVKVDDLALVLSGISLLAAEILACIWLVRAYHTGRALDPTLKPVSDMWLWFMWLIPVVGWVAPVLRLRGLQRAAGADGVRAWRVFAWAAVWLPVDHFQRDVRSSTPFERGPADVDPATGVPRDLTAYLAVGDRAVTLWTIGFGLAFALWAVLVITITRDLGRQRLASGTVTPPWRE